MSGKCIQVCVFAEFLAPKLEHIIRNSYHSPKIPGNQARSSILESVLIMIHLPGDFFVSGRPYMTQHVFMGPFLASCTKIFFVNTAILGSQTPGNKAQRYDMNQYSKNAHKVLQQDTLDQTVFHNITAFVFYLIISPVTSKSYTNLHHISKAFRMAFWVAFLMNFIFDIRVHCYRLLTSRYQSEDMLCFEKFLIPPECHGGWHVVVS